MIDYMNTTEQIHIDTDAIEMHQRTSVEINTDYYAELAGFLIEITRNSNVLKSDVCLENDQLKGLKMIIEAKVRFMLNERTKYPRTKRKSEIPFQKEILGVTIESQNDYDDLLGAIGSLLNIVDQAIASNERLYFLISKSHQNDGTALASLKYELLNRTLSGVTENYNQERTFLQSEESPEQVLARLNRLMESDLVKSETINGEPHYFPSEKGLRINL
jgi:hypothetical protein